MAASLAQSAVSSTINSSATTIALAYGSNVTAGNVLVAVVIGEAADTTIALTDTQGNTWSEVVRRAGSPPFSPDNPATVGVYMAAAGSSAADTVTATFGTSCFRSITLFEVAGITSPAAGGTNSGVGTTSAPDAGAVTVSGAANIVLFGVDGNWGTAITPPTGFTEVVDTNNFYRPYSAYLLNASTGSQSTTAGSTSSAWVAAAAVVEEGAAGGVVPRLALLGVG